MNNAMEKHSELPWHVGKHPGDSSGTEWRQILAPSPFGPMYVGRAVNADANLIVRAVNAHADLVALVRAYRKTYPLDVYADKADAALARAKAVS